MSQGVIARRYAKALIKLAEKEQTLEKTGECLSVMAEAYKDSIEFKEILSDPNVSKEMKQSILKAVLTKINSTALVDTFSRYLLAKRRIVLLPSIETAFNMLLQEIMGRIEARVTVAHELPKATVKKLEKSISEYSGKDVAISITIDPAIIGGIVTRIGSVVIDGSIHTQLNHLRQTIIRG